MPIGASILTYEHRKDKYIKCHTYDLYNEGAYVIYNILCHIIYYIYIMYNGIHII
jgi:hypothetical protein